jgi:tripartite-type tricarboxylate transporter receptor subunit TctC
VPTVAESGYPGFENTDWYGVLVPAGTPANIITRLNAEINRALTLPDVRERISALGSEVGGGTPGQLDERIKAEVRRWAKVLRNIDKDAQ